MVQMPFEMRTGNTKRGARMRAILWPHHYDCSAAFSYDDDSFGGCRVLRAYPPKSSLQYPPGIIDVAADL